MSSPAQVAIGIAVTAGALAYIGLHVFEPALPRTWSYAHLNRYAGAGILAVLLTLALPVAFVRASRDSRMGVSVPPLGFRAGVGAFVVLSLTFLVVGWFFPSAWLSLDPWHFAIEVWKGHVSTMRWYLTLKSFTAFLRVAEWLAPFEVPARDLIPVVNAFVSGLAYTLMIACARRLGRDRIDVVFLVALAWTAFGNLQVSIWYVDIYPTVQLLLLLFIWTSYRVLIDGVHPVWPFAVMALSPFFYVGTILMAPALLPVVLACARRADGIKQLSVATGVAVLLAGAATIPGFGSPFAFGAYLHELRLDSGSELGLRGDSSLLPWGYMFGLDHVLEYLHTWLLIDGMGALLGVTAGLPLLWGVLRGSLASREAVLLLLLGPILVYAFVMDPLWGSYADWDLFSYAAVPFSFFGGYALIEWGRQAPAARAFLMGLVLAANLIHLGARLNALEIDRDFHLHESPSHELGPTVPDVGSGARLAG